LATIPRATGLASSCHKKGAREVVLNQVELGLRWTLGKEDNQESVPIVELKDTQEIIVLTTLHLDDPH